MRRWLGANTPASCHTGTTNPGPMPVPHHYLRVCNHDEFQHQKHRSLPWIKWSFSWLKRYGFTSLTDAQKWHCVGLAMLASRTANHIPANTKWLKRELHATRRVSLGPLMDIGFVEWCGCKECRGLKVAPRTYAIALLPEEEA